MTVNRIWPTLATFSATPDGESVTDKLAEEGQFLARVAVEPTTNIGGTENVVTASLALSNIAALQEGNHITITPTADNTGAVTLNLNGLGAVTVKTAGGADLGAGQWRSGITHLLEYKGTNWRVLSPPIDTISGPEVVSITEPTGDITSKVVTGLSAYRHIEGFGLGRVTGAATLTLAARETSGSWRTLDSLSIAGAEDFHVRFKVFNFGHPTAPKLYEGWMVDSVTFSRTTEGSGPFAFTWGAEWLTYQESFDELRLSVSANAIEGDDANKRLHLHIDGQR